MSKENVNAFYEAASKDSTLQEELKAVVATVQNVDHDDATKALITFATSKGYKFSVDDLKDFEKSQIQQLSPNDLDKVNAAGCICFFIGLGVGKNAGSKNGCGVVGCAGIGLGWGGARDSKL